MQELIDSLEKSSKVDYLLDTCFLLYALEKEKAKQLLEFCGSNSVGISSFNLDEINHVHHKLDGTINHHLRKFLKSRAVCCVPVAVRPGDREGERKYVADFEEKVLQLVPDPSDAVLLVLALNIHANILTRDKHHLFTTAAENYLGEYGIEVLNGLPEKK